MTSLEKISFMDFREGNIVSTEEKRLTLAYEGLTVIPQNLLFDYGPILEILDLSHNDISNVEFLSQCKNLTTLILDHNHLIAETVFPKISSLKTLWLNNNLISQLHPFIQRLSESCPNITCLSLMGNTGAPSYLNGGTYYEYLQYRLFVISWLPKLEYLDDRQVSKDQIAEANRLYSRPFYYSLLSPQQYFQQFQNRFKEIINTFRWNSTPQEYRSGEMAEEGVGEAIRVQDMGNIHTDSSSSSSSLNLSISRSKRNLVI